MRKLLEHEGRATREGGVVRGISSDDRFPVARMYQANSEPVLIVCHHCDIVVLVAPGDEEFYPQQPQMIITRALLSTCFACSLFSPSPRNLSCACTFWLCLLCFQPDYSHISVHHLDRNNGWRLEEKGRETS